MLVAAIAHGELMTLQPFRWGSGLIARASVRLVLASRGVDPDLLGGLVVTIGSQRIDASIRTRLNSLAKAMQA